MTSESTEAEQKGIFCASPVTENGPIGSCCFATCSYIAWKIHIMGRGYGKGDSNLGCT